MRLPAVSGSFYPNDPQALRDRVGGCLSKVQQERCYPGVRGIICPHAGYIFSGDTAAYGFHQVQKSPFKTVIIVGPSHYEAFEIASVDGEDAYQTPLGTIPINQTVSKKIRNSHPLLAYRPSVHTPEHSVEMELPFLQSMWPEGSFTVVPVIIGTQRIEDLKILAKAIVDSTDPEETLLVASSDFSHFYPEEIARRKDLHALDLLEKGDMNAFIRESALRNIETCGFSAIVVMTEVVQAWGRYSAKSLIYQHSGQVTGNPDSVVGYGSVVYYKNE